ncbi:hypothetical protein BOTBODRAFT_172272 [Botryobasidium botryosum FD-172 SS1]|uniref:RING-type E3 ubiquitin transferase n=1 Tax=Botryobasidium botryosum (strain FD-172 SS1) TaxID=930990 RepID=A0A067MNR4_BOTB1|nr:hypothetical protein BOTBODRAFT_172272 [Botryobasidium botryosum FD-172 SS1]
MEELAIEPKCSRLESSPEVRSAEQEAKAAQSEAESAGEDTCIICLHGVVDRTVLPACSHDSFCFECILVWTAQSRKCPLCSAPFGTHLIHQIRSQYDFQKYYLPPLRTSPPPLPPIQRHPRRQRREEPEWGRSQRAAQSEATLLERAIEKRRWVYRHGLYAKHVASNRHTRFRPLPTPAQFAHSPELISRATAFIRRELRVWINLDVEFLTTFITSMLKEVDIRGEAAIRVLSEFLDMDSSGQRGGGSKAEHFAHELYSYLRSPYHELAAYDKVVQYDTPPHIPLPRAQSVTSRWQTRSRSRPESHTRSVSRSPSPSPSRFRSRSPSRSRSQEKEILRRTGLTGRRVGLRGTDRLLARYQATPLKIDVPII